MKKELTMNEVNQVCGGCFPGAETASLIRILVSLAAYDQSPTHDALAARLEEMYNDDNCWTFATAVAELQTIDPDFQVA